MENSHPVQENQTPSLVPSPNSHSSNSSSSSATHSNGFLHHHTSPASPRPPPPPVAPITRSEPNNPYPTTFVQADTNSFKKVVQMLTGSSETARLATRPDPVRSSIPPIKTAAKKEKSASKLFERRGSLKNFKISPLGTGLASGRPGFSAGHSGTTPKPGTPELLSPSILDFPSLVLSPVTPLIPDPFNRSPVNARLAASNCYKINVEAEEKAIKEKGFYLHQSPANTPRDPEPRLLPLFPVTSPRSNASNS